MALITFNIFRHHQEMSCVRFTWKTWLRLTWIWWRQLTQLLSLLHCTALYCTVLHCTVLYCTALHCTVLHCTALHCTVLHCTVLYSTVLFCTLPYLHSIFFSLYSPPSSKTNAELHHETVAAVRAINFHCFESTILIDIQNLCKFCSAAFVSQNVKLQLLMHSDIPI
jgi:hypothetical protein